MPPKKRSKGRARARPLPIMVRKSKAVFPLLAQWGLYQKRMLGDGNCLFASLSDQLYNTPKRHPEIRRQIVEHMRENRIDFEAWCVTEDMQSRRPLRERSAAASRRRVLTPDDQFENYLSQMATDGTFGGHSELLAFCQAWDRDVIIHRPQGQAQLLQQIENTRRGKKAPRKFVHVCFGDEDRRPHYDSIRNIDPSAPELPGPISVLLEAAEKTGYMRAELRNSKDRNNHGGDLTSEQIHNLIEQGRLERDHCLRSADEDRARSSSRSSSQRSVSSGKRSLEDDVEDSRANKRPDRRISLRNRTVALVSPIEKVPELPSPFNLGSSGPLTPNSEAQDSSSQDDSTPSQLSDDLDGTESLDRPAFSQSLEEFDGTGSVTGSTVEVEPGGGLRVPQIATPAGQKRYGPGISGV